MSSSKGSAAFSCSELVNTFQRKFLGDCERLQTPDDNDFEVPLRRAAQLFEICAVELKSPDAFNRVTLTGASDSFIAAPNVHHGFPKCYTVCMWIRLDSKQNTREITLFRARASNLCSTECTVVLDSDSGDSHTRVELKAKMNHRDFKHIGGRINLQADMSWHLITVIHKYQSFPYHGVVTMLIDDEIALERDFDYPFKPLSALSDISTAFEFGAGLTGSLGTISVYTEEILPEAVRCLVDAGPGFSILAGTANSPQYSTETGHSQLCLTYDKLVRNGSLKSPILCLTASHFNTEEWLPCIVPGGRPAAGDAVELEPRVSGSDILASPMIIGSCTAHFDKTFMRLWEASEGPSIVLFVLHHCIKEFKELSMANSPDDEMTRGLSHLVISAVQLISVLLKHSLAMREIMLQEHGFHVLSHCLRSLPYRLELLDMTLIDECVNLVRNLKTDLFLGDAAAAGLQGLLFDFSVWKHATLRNKIHLLTSISNLSPSIGPCLKQFIGLQRVLDIARRYVIVFKEPVVEGEDVLAEDAVIKLVVIMLKAAQNQYDSGKSGRQFTEIDAIFSCLEETSNSRFAERLILHTIELLYDCPDVFIKVLAENRFYDVTAVKLLTHSSYSHDVRRSALHLFIWGLVQAYPDIKRDILYWLKKLGRGAGGGEVWYQHDVDLAIHGVENREKRKVRRPLELIAVLKSKKATLAKMWSMICMVCAATERAIPTWEIPISETDTLYGHESALDASAMFVGPADYVLSVLCHDGPLGRLDCWMSLPWLAILLPHASIAMCQKALMSFSMSLKINEDEIAALSVLPDGRWVYHLLKIAKAMHVHLKKAGTSDIFSTQASSDDNKLGDSVETYASIAKACLDVALDSLAQIIVYQTIHFGEAGRLSWQQLVLYLQLDDLKEYEIDYLRQCVLYLFQKISRNHCGYNRYVLFALTKIVLLVEERQLCGNTLDRSKTGPVLGTISPTELKFDINERTERCDAHDNLTPVENKLLMFTVELSQKIRQGCEGYSLGDTSPEIKIILLFLGIFTGCLHRLSIDAAESVCSEIEAIIVHSIDGWLMYSTEYYKLFVTNLFNSLFIACRNTSIPAPCREKYKQLTVSVLHFFMAIKNTSHEDIRKHYPHVDDTLTELSVANECYSADAIFGLLNDQLARRNGACSAESFPVHLPEASHIKTFKLTDTAESFVRNTGNNEGNRLQPSDIKYEGSSEDMLFATELSSVEDEIETAAPPSSLEITRHHIRMTSELETKEDDVEQPFYFDLIAISETLEISDVSAFGSRTDLTRNKSTAESVEDLLMEYDDCGQSVPCDDPNSESSTLCNQNSEVIGGNLTCNPCTEDDNYARWKSICDGILSDRIDTERARMERFHMSCDMTTLATNEFWIKLCRKLDTEWFDGEAKEMWELAMRFEGQFPGRQRIVLLPWFLGSIEKEEMIKSVKGAEVVIDENDSLHTSDIMESLTKDDGNIRRKLLGAYVGHTNFMHEVEVSRDSPELDLQESEMRHGQGWNVVDVDNGEDGGYGVIGLAQVSIDNSIGDSCVVEADRGNSWHERQPDSSTAHNNSIISPERQHASAKDLYTTKTLDNQDTLLDLAVMAEGMEQGRDVETAPCFSGTKKLSRDTHVAEVSDVSLLTAVGNFIGTISFTEKELFFSTANDTSLTHHLHDEAAITLEAAHKKVRRRKWYIDAITGIFLRSYRLRQSGMEVLFSRGKYRSFFIDFGSSKSDVDRRNEFLKSLCSVAPKHALKQRPETSFYRLIASHGIQQEWINGRVSNFDYLMYINTIAGRSFNDLCQYPVMPWVIAQYEKDTIDLNDPSTYRDLSKPMGAQTEERLERIRCRYEALTETEDILPPFMYGSHYSTMVGVVLYYLLRLQPYAELHKVVQSGHFDTANRLFASIKKAWRHNSETTFEVKELTPEWFTLPDFLRNTNRFDFGQSDESDAPLNDVELPNWAASPEDFIRINREALESDFVSSHLHEWIDLIFGYKQRGQAAVDANNLFYYLTYPGAIDRDRMDAITLEGVDAQIAHFGQCPSLVFDKPHPAKRISSRVCVPRPLRHCFSRSIGVVAPMDVEEALSYNACVTVVPGHSTIETPGNAIIGVKISGQRLFCIRDNGAVNVYRHTLTQDTLIALRGYLANENDTAPVGATGLCSVRSRSGLVVGALPETRGGIVKTVSNFLGRIQHSDGTALHKVPVQRMKNRYEGVKIPQLIDQPLIEEGYLSVDDLAVRDSCRTHFVGRQVLQYIMYSIIELALAFIFF